MAGALTVGTITFPIFLAGAAGGCIAGAATGAGLGVMVGMIVVGVPVGIAVAVDFFNRINAPDPSAQAPAQ